jgi:alanine-synthesizing transaminase
VFSSRVPPDLRPNPLTRLLASRRAAGLEILDLTESNPTRAGLAYPTEEILASLSNPACLTYDPQPAGLLAAREAVAAYYAARSIPVSPTDLLLTASTSEGYALLFKLLCNPGDEILTPRPSYPLFEHLAALEGVRVTQYPLRYDGAWRIDLEALSSAITPRTRAVALVNPNNPTGSFLKHDELAALDRLCAAHSLALLSDEVFSDYAFSPDPHRAETAAGPRESLTFVLSGLSKVAGLPQMKLGWIAVQGPAALREPAFDRLEWIADAYLSASAPVQCAAHDLLRLGATIRASIAQRTTRNAHAARQLFSGDSPFRVLNCEGGWYSVIEAPRIRTEEDWTLELLKNGTLVQPGYFFDFDREAYLVVSGLAKEEIFDEGLARIARLA